MTDMNEEFDFSKGKRGPVLPPPAGKTRITLWLDDDIIESFRQRAGEKGIGYQTEINRALRETLGGGPVSLDAIRDVIRQELRAARRGIAPAKA